MNKVTLPFKYDKRHPIIEIGCRHTTKHRIYHDHATGEYQEMNPPILGFHAFWQKVLCESVSMKPIFALPK